MGYSRPLFLYFRLLNTVESQQHLIKTLPISGLEPRTSGVGSNHFAKWATTTALTGQSYSGIILAVAGWNESNRSLILIYKRPSYKHYIYNLKYFVNNSHECQLFHFDQHETVYSRCLHIENSHEPFGSEFLM